MLGLLSKYLFIFMLSSGTTLAVVPLLMRLAFKTGLVDHPDQRRTHDRPTPLCGGIAIFISLHLAMSAVYLLGWDAFSGHLNLQMWIKLLIPSAMIMVLGIYDDRFNISARAKLAGQIIIATTVYFSGVNFGKLLYIGLPPWLSFPLTILWLTGAMNAFNLIDGMDGLASGLGLIAATGLGLLAIFTHNLSDALLMVALASACLAFLFYNFYPAKAFLGDSGSMLIGFILAWFALATNTKAPAMTALIIPMLAMGVPLLDTFLAMWRRLVRHLLDGKGGKSTGIFTADREHLHDRLRATGLSQRRAALALYILAALLMLAGLLATAYSSHRTGILMAAFALFSYIVIRHLARVELWDSGRLVVNGLQRPTTKVMAVIFYPFADTIILALSFALIVRLAGTTTGNESFKELWRALAPMGIAVPFIGIVCSGAYHRVWSRASAAEYGWLMICLVGAIALTGTLLDFGNGITLHSILLVQLLYTGSALPWIMLVRIFPRLVQSSMLSLNRHRTASRNACATLLCGAGYDATLFLRQHGYRGESAYETFRILGFIDNDSNLRGRIVHGHRVLGNIADLEQLADKLDIKCVIITTSLPDDEMQKLKKTAGRHSIRLMLWQHTMTTIQE